MCDSMRTVELFTDGACSGNPGPGGWASILLYQGRELILCSGEEHTTNNRMELTAVIEGLKVLKPPCKVNIYTDSQYVANGINLGWAKKWQSKGWKKSDNNPALNADLWQNLLDAVSRCDCHFIWVNGHSGHTENERCDVLAVKMSKIYAKLIK